MGSFFGIDELTDQELKIALIMDPLRPEEIDELKIKVDRFPRQYRHEVTNIKCYTNLFVLCLAPRWLRHSSADWHVSPEVPLHQEVRRRRLGPSTHWRRRRVSANRRARHLKVVELLLCMSIHKDFYDIWLVLCDFVEEYFLQLFVYISHCFSNLECLLLLWWESGIWGIVICRSSSTNCNSSTLLANQWSSSLDVNWIFSCWINPRFVFWSIVLPLSIMLLNSLICLSIVVGRLWWDRRKFKPVHTVVQRSRDKFLAISRWQFFLGLPWVTLC